MRKRNSAPMQFTRVAVRAYLAVSTFALVACTASSTSTADATAASAGPSVAPATIPSATVPAAFGSPGDGTKLSYSKGTDTASYGVATQEEFRAIGLPIYDAIRNRDASFVRYSNPKEIGQTLYGKTTDAFETVDAWYAAQLGPSFKATHFDSAGHKVTKFTKDEPGDYESVLLRGGKSVKTAIPTTDVTLLVKKKR